jgi:hypothetical protein
MAEMARVCVPGGTVSVLLPSPDFTNDDLAALIEKLSLTGFSRAALTKWHGSAPKKSRSQIEALFERADLEPVVTRSYLEGMLGAATATAGPRAPRPQ